MMKLIITLPLLVSLMLFCFSATGVEMTEEQYLKTVADIKQIYSAEQNHRASLQILREEKMEDMLLYFPPEESQGVLTIKTPVTQNNITILQIPHAFFDLHSLDIGQQMFDTQWVDVMMVNTQHRYETQNSDLARLRYSLFTAMVEAMLQMDKQVNIVQVHGFNEKKRTTESAQQADLILSNGSVIPDTYMLKMQSCLRDNTQLLARLYGRDVFELGATVNPVGKLLREYAKQPPQHQINFLHIELPRTIRQQMISGQDNRQVLKCLLSH